MSLLGGLFCMRRNSTMIKSGDQLKVINTVGNHHNFRSGETVYFIGVVLEGDDVRFLCTNGQTEHMLFKEDIEPVAA
jgi:hypothetical protein